MGTGFIMVGMAVSFVKGCGLFWRAECMIVLANYV